MEIRVPKGLDIDKFQMSQRTLDAENILSVSSAKGIYASDEIHLIHDAFTTLHLSAH